LFFGFSSGVPLGAMVTAGIALVARASRPCFNAPAGQASAWM